MFEDKQKRTKAQRIADDKKVMDAVLAREHKGWSKVSATTFQYCVESGYGFVSYVRGQWQWIAHPAGEHRETGTCTLREAAQLAVQNAVNQA